MKYKFKKYQKSNILYGHLKMGGSNPGGETIDANSLYFTRNGKPWIGVMGEYHFSRDKRENWHTELCKMKAGGISIISTYLFWNYHEEEEGCFDFSGNHDIRAFIEACAEVGLDFVLRLGPWAHGEARYGGFPDWLMEKDYPLRANNEGFMHQVRSYWTRVFEEIDGLFYDQGGNIIALQLENEKVDDAGYILALKELALEIGFRAPIYTATGWNRSEGALLPEREVLPVFGGYVEAPWDVSLSRLPMSMHFFFLPTRNDSAVGSDLREAPATDNPTEENPKRLKYEEYPFATCEIGGGVENTHHRRSVIDPFDIYASSLVKVGCGNNLIGYYMYHGGQHKLGKYHALGETRACGYPNDYPTISYDFQAPLSEFGVIREHYRLLNMLHMFIHDFGELLAPMEFVQAERFVEREDTTSLRYGMRTDGRSGFVFINHHQRHIPLEDCRDVIIDTGNVTFPAIDVCGRVCFFMPFMMQCGDIVLESATAQPLCKDDNTYYFVEIPGVKARFTFEDGSVVIPKTGRENGFAKGNTAFVLLSLEEALYTRKIEGKLYFKEGVDLYLDRGEIKELPAGRIVGLNRVSCAEPFEVTYDYELSIGGERKRSWYRLSVDQPDGMIEIPDRCDAAQLYADGKLVADEFYKGNAWRLPASLIYGKEAYLVTTEIRDDFYME